MFDLAYSSKNAHLLRKGAFGRNSTIPLEHAALAEAARHNRYAVVRALIEKGLDLNAALAKGKESCKRSDGHPTSEEQDFWTNPLHDSVALGNLRITRLLLENGANANARTCRWGKTALFNTVGPPRDGVIASPINVLDAVKRTTMIRLLLDYGADINVKSNENESIVYAAACGGCTEVLKLLREAGACNSLEDTTQTDGYTPLMAASWAKHGAVTRMLLEMGADCNTHASNGLDALALAVELDHPVVDPTSTMKALLQYRADINGDGQTISPLS